MINDTHAYEKKKTTLKSYSNVLFLLKQTNNLCTCITKIVIIIFLNKVVCIKMKFVISIFRAINRINMDVAYYFKIPRVLDFVLAALIQIQIKFI